MSRQTKLYLNKGSVRKKQVYNWLLEVIRKNFFINQKLNIAIKLLANNKQNKALSEFAEIIDYIIDNNIDNLGYIIENNIQSFGRDRVIMDLYKGVLGSQIRALNRTVSGKVPRRSGKRIQEVEAEIKQVKIKKRFGLLNGKRREAVIEIVLIKKKPQNRLRDIKTGRFLKQTKSFKKEIEKSKGGKK